MKTSHLFTDSYCMNIELKNAIGKKIGNRFRLIECGRGLVILPETNAKADCQMPEIIKALGLVKNGKPISMLPETLEKTVNRTDYLLFTEDGEKMVWSLTPDQERLLAELNDHGFICDVTFEESDIITRIEV